MTQSRGCDCNTCVCVLKTVFDDSHGSEGPQATLRLASNPERRNRNTGTFPCRLPLSSHQGKRSFAILR